jgi:hypothetical protein
VVRFPLAALRGLGHVAGAPVRFVRDRVGRGKGSSKDMAKALERAGQGHLLEGLSAEQREALLKQAAELDGQLPGGIRTYVETAKGLLKDSGAGVNPFEGFTPEVPAGEKLTVEPPRRHSTRARCTCGA